MTMKSKALLYRTFASLSIVIETLETFFTCYAVIFYSIWLRVTNLLRYSLQLAFIGLTYIRIDIVVGFSHSLNELKIIITSHSTSMSWEFRYSLLLSLDIVFHLDSYWLTLCDHDLHLFMISWLLFGLMVVLVWSGCSLWAWFRSGLYSIVTNEKKLQLSSNRALHPVK